MGSCDFDHSLEDVNKKLTDQKPFLPEELFNGSLQLLQQKPDQLTLNELFHLLKKYDLATDEVKEERNRSLGQLVGS